MDKTIFNQSEAAKICPLCQSPNNCHVAADKNFRDCWCMAQKIDKEALQSRLSHLEEQGTIDKRCICPKCAEQLALL